MDDKKKNPGNSDGGAPMEPGARSAFRRRDKSEPETGGKPDKPIPSQPRSFSSIRPQGGGSSFTRKHLAQGPAAAGSGSEEKKEATPAPGAGKPEDGKSQSAASDAPAADAGTTPKTDATDAKTDRPADGDVKTGEVTAAGTPPQSSGAGGDTLRLRVNPRGPSRSLNTTPSRGVRRRLPDIRQGRATSGGQQYGIFSLFFGFLWLNFKVIFFTLLMFGLGALLGFIAMTEYIKTKEVIVPDVSGMTVAEAFDELGDRELGIRRLRVETSTLVAPGEIISQQPTDGQKVKVNTQVGVVISSGRSRYIVPNVVNETQENAVNKIAGARLKVGSILQIEDASIAPGNVISQDPQGDTGLDEPREVNLMVSSGPPGKSLSMPDLTGRTLLEAQTALKALGISDVTVSPANSPPDAIVREQIPLVGKTVFTRDKVTLTVRR